MNKTLEHDRINVLGTEYEIKILTAEQDQILSACAGYCDSTRKLLVLRDDSEEPGDWEYGRKQVLRHEIIHAFLFESGLSADASYEALEGQTHPEMVVDWFAIQSPKIFRVFQYCGLL